MIDRNQIKNQAMLKPVLTKDGRKKLIKKGKKWLTTQVKRTSKDT